MGSSNWETGSIDTTQTDDPVNTNVNLFLDVQWAQLGPYTKSAGIYRCKASRVLVSEFGQTYPLPRTVSFNGWMGYINVDWFSQPYVSFQKTTDLVNLSTSEAYVFVDERDDSVDDGCFAVDMERNQIVNVPSNYHDGAGTLGFADGHAEIHRWRTPELQIPQPSGLNPASSKNVFVSATNTDMVRLRQHATYARAHLDTAPGNLV